MSSAPAAGPVRVAGPIPAVVGPRSSPGSRPRRRSAVLAGPLLVGVGAFLLVTAVLVPQFVYPRLALQPVDPDVVQVQTTDDATALVPDLTAKAGAEVRHQTRQGATALPWLRGRLSVVLALLGAAALAGAALIVRRRRTRRRVGHA